MNEPSDESPASTPTRRTGNVAASSLEPMEGAPTLGNAISALLRKPGSVVFELGKPGSKRFGFILLAGLIACLVAFGLLLGSYAGGSSWWTAPTKLVLGTLASALICLPSLLIFSYNSGVDCSPGRLISLLLVALTLLGLLLVGFAPVLWVFIQSNSSLAFIGTLSLFLWTVCVLFALRVILTIAGELGARSPLWLMLWGCIFLLVSYQMTAALRPIIGTSETFFPAKKQSFLEALHFIND